MTTRIDPTEKKALGCMISICTAAFLGVWAVDSVRRWWISQDQIQQQLILAALQPLGVLVVVLVALVIIAGGLSMAFGE